MKTVHQLSRLRFASPIDAHVLLADLAKHEEQLQQQERVQQQPAHWEVLPFSARGFQPREETLRGPARMERMAGV